MPDCQRLPYPTRLTIDIHSYCNGACVMCPYPELSKELPMGKMEWGLYAKILDEFSEIAEREGFRPRLGFCVMGEPFVEKKIMDFVGCALERNMLINFTTNCELLRPETVDALLEAGFDGTFNMSFHGIRPETVKRVMGTDVEKMLEHANYLIERYPKDRIHVTAIHIDWPKGERGEVLRYWRDRGIKVHSPLAGSRAGLVEGYEESAIGALKGCKSRRPLYHMTVAFNGDVTLCCNDMARRVVLGNLGKQSIEEVWNGKKFLACVDMVYGKRPAPRDFICRQCEWGMDSIGPWARIKKEFRRGATKLGLWAQGR